MQPPAGAASSSCHPYGWSFLAHGVQLAVRKCGWRAKWAWSEPPSLEFQQVGDRGNGERSLLADTSDVEMLTS